MNNNKVHLNSLPVDMTFYRVRGKKIMEETDKWIEQKALHDVGARIFSWGGGRSMRMVVLFERDGLYYTTLDGAITRGLGKVGDEEQTGMRPGIMLDPEKYKQYGLDYVAYALMLSAAGYAPPTRKHASYETKLQVYLSSRQFLKVCAEAARLGITRTAVVRRLIDQLDG